MEELTADHVFGRRLTGELAEANEQYRRGDQVALAVVAARLRALCEFYPSHIAREDKEFFPAARTYFSEEEDRLMLARFREFDATMIHARYASVVEGLEQ